MKCKWRCLDQSWELALHIRPEFVWTWILPTEQAGFIVHIHTISKSIHPYLSVAHWFLLSIAESYRPICSLRNEIISKNKTEIIFNFSRSESVTSTYETKSYLICSSFFYLNTQSDDKSGNIQSCIGTNSMVSTSEALHPPTAIARCPRFVQLRPNLHCNPLQANSDSKYFINTIEPNKATIEREAS